MRLTGFLICFPFLIAFILFFVKNISLRRFIVIVSGAMITLAAVTLGVFNFHSEQSVLLLENTHIIDTIMIAVEILLMFYIVFLGFKYRKYHVSLLSFIQTGMIAWLELSGKTEETFHFHLRCDKLAIIMALIIGVIGCLICFYALGYMQDYHHHHHEFQDRKPMFFALLFIFLGAMFGLVFSNNLIWLYFFWEITTLCSFLLIGYTKAPEAVTNSFRALWMNLLGGLGFAIAIVYSCLELNTTDLNTLVETSPSNAKLLIPIAFLAFAGITKSAQLPFSKWLLGAMVAPTPTSALLHSATMVKAGVYLLIRLAPTFAGNTVGLMVIMIGGFTFFATSLLAISQNDAKKVLAYSTISNLGLITACAGVGTPESVWAAVFLMIFHAVSKSLMFLTVGAVEHTLGSRNIEDMHGLIVKLPELALVLTIGIAGMFLAPFGMLVSKWAALKSFVDSNNVLLIVFLVYGSASTLFYWTKWLGNLMAVHHNSERLPNSTHKTEWFTLGSLATIMVVMCLLFPAISVFFIEPFLVEMFKQQLPQIISDGNFKIMTLMLSMIAIFPFAIRFLTFGKSDKMVMSYMAGINCGDDREFVDSFGKNKRQHLASWYMENLFGEGRLLKPSIAISATFLITILIIAIGGALR